MEKETYKMFDALTNFELWRLALKLNDTLPENLRTEIWAQERKGHESRGSQFKFLNRLDLLNIIYGYIKEEIRYIDEAPLNKVPLLLFNNDWSVPQLKERLSRRMKLAR